MKRRLKYAASRYAHPIELRYYAQGMDAEFIAHRLKFATSTVQKWLDGKALIPWWTVEMLRLQHWEHWQFNRQVCGIKATEPPKLFLAISNKETALLTYLREKEEPIKLAGKNAVNDSQISKLDKRYKYYSMKHKW